MVFRHSCFAVSLNYGRQGRFSCEMESTRILASRPAPQPNPQFADELAEALAQPLDFPPLEQALVPGDRVVLALDRNTPESAALVAATWQVLTKREIVPENVVIIQPAALIEANLPDPRRQLPEEIQQRVRWKVHNPENRSECTYLSTTALGERIYIAHAVVDADIVISIGQIAYDPVIGYRGTNSVLYPGLSSTEAIRRAQGQGHRELSPDDVRPLRQLIDEVGWLLGIQFSIQVLPAACGGVSHVLAGAADSVLRRGKKLLAEHWLVQLESRPEIVVAAVDCDSRGQDWEQIGACLETSRSLVAQGGKILILSEFEAKLGAGLKLLGEYTNPRDALQPLWTQAPADLVPATQLATAVDWADVYLLSKLDSDLVENLFMIPVEHETEISRLLNGNETCVFLETAQYMYGQIGTA